jgi:hypothetical protein
MAMIVFLSHANPPPTMRLLKLNDDGRLEESQKLEGNCCEPRRNAQPMPGAWETAHEDE